MTVLATAPFNLLDTTRDFDGNVPDGVTQVTIRIARCTTATPTIWPLSSQKLKLEILISYDGGANYGFAAGADAEGGIHIRRNGSESPETTLFVPINPSSGRKFRGRVTTVGRVNSTVTIEAD